MASLTFIVLPPELLLHVADQCNGQQTLLALAQTCKLLRHVVLSRVFRTLSSATTIDRVLSLPDHLRPYVRNIWVDDQHSPPRGCVADAWFWHALVPNLLLPAHLFLVHALAGAVPEGLANTNQRVQLTLTSGFYLLLARDARGTRWNAGGYADCVTHMRVHAYVEVVEAVRDILDVGGLRKLTHLALCVQKPWCPGLDEDAVKRCVEAAERRGMSCVVVDSRYADPRELAEQTRESKSGKVFYTTGSADMRQLKKEWLGGINGEHDVWKRGEMTRTAVLACDDSVIKLTFGCVLTLRPD